MGLAILEAGDFDPAVGMRLFGASSLTKVPCLFIGDIFDGSGGLGFRNGLPVFGA